MFAPAEIHRRVAPQRVLCLQSTSLSERYGGIEYYVDDFLNLATHLYGSENITSLVPTRGNSSLTPSPKYHVRFTPFLAKGWMKKLENRYSPFFLRDALSQANHLNPTLILCSHVSLCPLAWLISSIKRIPYATIVFGVEAWGNLWPQDEWCLRRSKGIVSISHWTKDILIKRGYPPNQIHVVHPMLPKEFETINLPPREQKTTFNLLTVSRLDPSEQYKGQDHVLFALEKLKRTGSSNFHYTIQGDGKDRERLEALTHSLGLQDHVAFLPAVTTRAELSATYRQADLYIMPSQFGRREGRWRGEGFGIVYIEAAAHGIPSIAYACGGATDIIKNGENGVLVEPGNMSELADAIAECVQNREWTRELGEKARQDTLAHFAGCAIRREFEEALSHIMK